jgi:imidazolonepropionase-like amidohydrolase
MRLIARFLSRRSVRHPACLGVLWVAAWLGLRPQFASADEEGLRATGFRPRALAVVGAKLVLAPGRIVDQGNLVIRDGRIADAGTGVGIPVDAEVVDGAGLVAYPAFIDAAGPSLLNPDETPQPETGRDPDFRSDVLAATRPDNRRGLTPEFESSSALKIDTAKIDGHRSEGIATVHVTPWRAIAGGQSCLLSLAGGPERESLLADSTCCVFQIASPGGSRGSSTVSYPTTLIGATAHLRQAFLDARHYEDHVRLYAASGNTIPRPVHDPVLEILLDALNGNRKTLFVAETRDDIHRALDFATEHGLQPVLAGCRDAAECVERIRELSVPVLLGVDFGGPPQVEPQKSSDKLEPDRKPPLRVQQDALDQWKRRAATAARLHDAGVTFAFSTHGLDKPQEWRQQVRRAVEHGLPADAALAALTQSAADILGVGDRLGSLDPGKLGQIVLLTGAWDNEQSKVRYLIIDGHLFEYNKDAKPLPTTAEPPPQLAGKWQVQIESGDMQATNAVLEFTQEGARLAGTFLSEQGNGQLASGSLNGTLAEFVVAIGAGDRAVQLKFSGDYQAAVEAGPEQLKGTLKSPFGAPTNWTATRLKSDEPPPNNPVQISVQTDDDRSKTEQTAASEFPTELNADRRERDFPTGGSLLVTNATVLTGTGETLAETDILIQQGQIAAIGPDLTPPDGVKVLDVPGWYVMPGMIDTHSHIMIEAGVNESSQSIVPEVRIRDAVATDDVDEYRALAGGLTTARLLHGSANVIGGQDAVVKLKHGLTAAGHILFDAPQGVKFALGENVKARQDRFPNTRMGVEATLKRAFFEALDYRRQWQAYEHAVKEAESHTAGRSSEAAAPAADDVRSLLPPRRDLRLEALADIISHEKFIHSHCYRADEILMLLRTTESLGIRVQSLQHVLEGYKIAPEIVAHGASCSTFADWWAYKIEAYDAIPYNTTLLYKAGANVVVKSDNAELMRHMNQEASKSLRYGNMPADAALQMVTRNAARELGLADRIGSIEVGKDGDLAIFNGHPLNIFARCEVTIIDGDVWFKRDQQPTAMTDGEQERSHAPPALSLAPSAVRERTLELPAAINAIYAVAGGTIHPVDAPDIPHGVVVIADGKIQAVGAEVDVPADAAVVDAAGMHVYPGLIDSGTTLGINEIRQLGVTQDFDESGRFQPDMRAGIAVNVDSELIPVARAGGVTTAFLRPNGTTVAGQYSLLQTAGWTSEEMVQEYEAGLSLDWPGDEKVVDELRQLLKDARLYDKIQSEPEATRPPVIQDPRYEALRPYLKGDKRVFIEAHSRKEIAQALLFAEEEKLKIVITGGTDAWKLVDELKQREIQVIVGPTMRHPVENWDPFDATYANAGRLFEAGVPFCIRSDNASNSRNVSFEAGICVAYGLPEEEALKAVTLNAAKVLGIDDRVGSLTPGKTANVLIADGSPLQPTTQIKGVFVAGRPYKPESKQTRMYERYLQRLKPTED